MFFQEGSESTPEQRFHEKADCRDHEVLEEGCTARGRAGEAHEVVGVVDVAITCCGGAFACTKDAIFQAQVQ